MSEAPQENQGSWGRIRAEACNPGQGGAVGAGRGLAAFTVDMVISCVLFFSVGNASAVFVFRLKLHSYFPGKDKENCKNCTYIKITQSGVILSIWELWKDLVSGCCLLVSFFFFFFPFSVFLYLLARVRNNIFSFNQFTLNSDIRAHPKSSP